jgi:hypothetical protein
MKSRHFLVTLAVLGNFVTGGVADAQKVSCEGSYPHHLQGVCSDQENIYWSFTTTLVKTDSDGKLLQKIPVANHHGDLCSHDGKLYVAVNLGKFNDPKGNADSWVYIYNAADLAFIEKHQVEELFYGAGGMGVRDGHFFVVGGLPDGVQENCVYEYDGNFKFVKKHIVASGHTFLGIQTATFADNRWWFGCYGDPKILLVTDANFQMEGRHEFDCSLGITPIGNKQFQVAEGKCTKESGCTGRLVVAEADSEHGLVKQDSTGVSFHRGDDTLQINVRGQPIADYVYADDEILRPYFSHLRTLTGEVVTRNHPPVKGQDADDHATMHPGLWLAFGDLNGADFWRNKGRVRHQRFIAEPTGDSKHGEFTAENTYEVDGRTICTETCRITVSIQPEGYSIDWLSTFQSPEEFTFGDQEEMGLGLRIATPLSVVSGGEILDSEGRKNGADVWGKQADWCQYSGIVDQHRVGVILMPSPDNFRRSWFHARDYGLLVANPFGQNAFTKLEKSAVTVKPGETFKLGFGLLVYQVPANESLSIAKRYTAFVNKKSPSSGE